MIEPTFSVEIDDDQLLAGIDHAIEQLQHPRPLMDAIGAYLVQAAELRFETKTDPSGNAWAPLSPATIDIYTSDWFKAQPGNEVFADGIPGTLLERTRQLRNSLAFNAGDDYVDVGTSRASKGGKWQIGWLMETGTGRMPRRGILVADPTTGALGADDQAQVLVRVSRFLGGLFG